MTPVRPPHPSWRGARRPVRRIPAAAVAARSSPVARTMTERPEPSVAPWSTTATAGAAVTVDAPAFVPAAAPAPAFASVPAAAPAPESVLRVAPPTGRLPLRVPNPDPELEGSARELFDLAPVAMQVADEDGYFLYVNAATPRVFGMAAEDLVGMHVSELTHPAEHGEDRDLFRRLAAGEIPRYSVRKRYVTGYGEVIWALTTVTRFTPGSDGRVRLLGQVQNLTNVPGFSTPDVSAHGPETTQIRALDVSAWETTSFRAALERQLARCRDHGERAALLVVEIEPRDPRLRALPRFASDEQHEAIGDAIRRRLKGADIVGRLDRRRFAVVQPYADLEQATTTGHDLVGDITRASAHVPMGVPVRVSVAVAALDPCDTSAERVVNRVTLMLLQEGPGGGVVVQVPL
jgi:PAS domain S-box-containing protein